MTELILRLFVKNYRDTENPKVRAGYGILAGVVGIICNLLLFAGKLLAGILSGSLAVSADAFNNLSDASSSLVTLLGFHLAERPADDEHPYGHARIEYISGLAVAALILIIGVLLGKSSIEKIIHPESIVFSWLTLGILLGSIVVKLWMSLFCRSLGKRIDSMTLTATAADSRNDVISTAAVLLGCLLSHFFGWHIDGYIGLLVALFIVWSGCSIAKQTISPLLGEQADPELTRRIRELVLSHEKIIGIHDLMVHDYGPGQCFATVHAEMSAAEDPLICHDVIDDIERDALRELRVHLVIHYDPIVTNDAELNHMRALVEGFLHEISPSLRTHDFRMVRGPGHTNLIFDMELPFAMAAREKELKQRVDERVKQENPRYYTVITFDEVSTHDA